MHRQTLGQFTESAYRGDEALDGLEVVLTAIAVATAVVLFARVPCILSYQQYDDVPSSVYSVYGGFGV